MAKEPREDDEQMDAAEEAEQVRNDADTKPEGSGDPEKVKEDEWMDDRFQATDN